SVKMSIRCPAQILDSRSFFAGSGSDPPREQLAIDTLAGAGVEVVRPLAGIIDEELLAGTVNLAHRQAALRYPATVDLAELRVLVAARVPLQVFEVEQLQRHPGPPPLRVQQGTVR